MKKKRKKSYWPLVRVRGNSGGKYKSTKYLIKIFIKKTIKKLIIKKCNKIINKLNEKK